MKRVFSSYRPFGPLFKSSNMYSSNEDRYLTRLSESGAESITTTQVGDRLVIDFLTIGDEPSKEFSSTVSISDGEVGSCLLRLPHVVAGPDVWHRMSYDIAEVIDRTTDIDPYEGLLKRERSMTGIV